VLGRAVEGEELLRSPRAVLLVSPSDADEPERATPAAPDDDTAVDPHRDAQ
jgi:hypothetical protein